MILKYNNYDPGVEPSTYTLTYTDVDGGDTGESETGVTLVHVVRAKKIKISVGYTALTTAQLSSITSRLEGDTISITYFDGASKLATMRCKSTTVKMVSNVDGGVWNLSFTLEQY